MPDLPYKRIIMHWTVSGEGPDAIKYDRKFYHGLILKDGSFVRAVTLPANIPLKWGLPHDYAPHTASLNSWSIGLSFVGMAAGKPGVMGDLSAAQWRSGVLIAAAWAHRFGIPVQLPYDNKPKGGTEDSRGILGHCEVESALRIAQSGKWDPWYPMTDWPWTHSQPLAITAKDLQPVHRAIGDQFRAEVAAVVARLQAGETVAMPSGFDPLAN